MRALSVLKTASVVVFILSTACLFGAFYTGYQSLTIDVHTASGGVDPIALGKRKAAGDLLPLFNSAGMSLLIIAYTLSLRARWLETSQRGEGSVAGKPQHPA